MKRVFLIFLNWFDSLFNRAWLFARFLHIKLNNLGWKNCSGPSYQDCGQRNNYQTNNCI